MKNIALFGYGRLGNEVYSLLPEYDMKCVKILRRSIEISQTDQYSHSVHSLSPDIIDVIVEVALPEGIEERVSWAIEHKKPIVIATTGWQDIRNDLLKKATEKGASLVWSSNYSLGVWLFRRIVKEASSYLREPFDFDCALFEAHHKKKKDAPSGTLLSILGDIQSELPQPAKTFSSISTEVPPVNETSIDIASLRVGSVPGTHMVWLDGKEETIQLTHTTRDRKTFARGIIKAIELLEKYPGVWEFDRLIEHALRHS